MRVCLLATLLAGVALAHAGKIKHVVVLMEENRSFDHMFGYGAQARRFCRCTFRLDDHMLIPQYSFQCHDRPA